MNKKPDIPIGWWDDRDFYRDRIARLYFPLAERIAAIKSRQQKCKSDDFLSAAGLGLSKAIETYDPNNSAGASFSTYAQGKIEGEIAHANRDTSHIPRSWIEISSRVRRRREEINKLRAANGAKLLTASQVARSLRINEWDLIAASIENPNPVSLSSRRRINEEYHDRTGRSDHEIVRLALFSLSTEERQPLEDFMLGSPRIPAKPLLDKLKRQILELQENDDGCN